MPQSYCIFNIPRKLLRHNQNSFLPNCFAIGPMHHGKENLVATERIKIKYLKACLSRVIIGRHVTMSRESKEVEKQKVLSDLINVVKSIEKQASACYAGHDVATELGGEFVKTMLLDGVFVIELFRRDAEEVKEHSDPILTMSCMLQYLQHDLILLENQIPWLVLEILFEKTRLPYESKSLIELALTFFANTFISHPLSIKSSCFKDQDIKHILDLLRLSLVLPSHETKNKLTAGWQPIHSISKLKEVGVKFKKVAPDSILDIKFIDGCLEIPSLLIQEMTQMILWNLIIYEQCLPHFSPIFTCYAKLLDNLIDTNNDMEILCKSKIFDNWLSLDDSTQFFSNLYNDTYANEFYYFELSDKLDHHCKWWWPRWRAYYVHNFCTKPWVIAAQIYVVIMFVLILWQTYK
ncbi:putative Calcium-binding EF-hand family protein [Hibiscus syriacus]|uniref:Calcium-binding EF-hand family protein n=2 Tax=Hibiscus syriacus TaxID=106335 RepID=A0A6A3A193_HIBSY|nr:putative Calcium-binding EF-hand family protein [Hibiscus syriacus]